MGLAAGCGQKKAASKQAAPVPVLVARAATKTMPVLIDPPPIGHVQPIASVTIRPQIGGIVSAVNFAEGQDVKKGDLLLTLDPRPAQATLALAQGNLQRDTAQLENATLQFKRDQKLFDQKLISEDVFETTKAAMEAASGTVAADRGAVSNAELNLQYTRICAPIDGRTGALLVHEGNVVKSPDDILLTLNQLQPITAAFAVAEKYLPEIQLQLRKHKLTVTASYENLVGEPPQGELTFVDNSVDATTGTILLKATFPNTDGRLWPGQFVQLALQINELTDAVVVPSQAVQNGQIGQFVFVVKSDKTVELRTVKTSVTVKGEAAITDGVKTGETVVTDGQLRLAPGTPVNF